MVLRWLATQWLRESAGRVARDTISQQVSNAAKAASHRAANEKQDQTADEPVDWSELTCHAAILYALEIEAAGLVDKLQSAKRVEGSNLIAHVGLLNQQRVVIAITGTGEERAASATRAVLAGHQPRWLISAGFAGGLAPSVKRTDLVVADALLRQGGDRLAIDLAMQPTAGLHLGGLLTIDHIARSQAEKKSLHEATGALAVDMETFAIAEVCQAEKVRMLSIRAITDAADDELPRDIEHLMNQASTVGRVGAVTGAIFRRPGSVKDMWNLHEQAIVCSNRLAKFLPGMIVQLPE